MKIQTVKDDRSLCEIGQTMDIKMSFSRKDDENTVTRLHELVKCRDFLGDFIWANRYQKPTSIYGFIVDPKIQQINKSSTCFLLKFPTTNSLTNFKENIHIVQQIEKDNGWLPTEVEEVDNSHLLVTANTGWQQNVFLISLYTYLLRCCGYSLGKDWFDSILKQPAPNNERAYAERTKDILFNVLKNLNRFVEVNSITGYPNDAECAIGIIHNVSGFVSLIHGRKNVKNLFCEVLNKL